MYIISYDISDDKLRTKFSNFLKKYWRRIQYSVFEIKNSKRLLNLIKLEIHKKFAPKFGATDSVLIFPINPQCSPGIYRYWYPVEEEKELVIV